MRADGIARVIEEAFLRLTDAGTGTSEFAVERGYEALAMLCRSFEAAERVRPEEDVSGVLRALAAVEDRVALEFLAAIAVIELSDLGYVAKFDQELAA